MLFIYVTVLRINRNGNITKMNIDVAIKHSHKKSTTKNIVNNMKTFVPNNKCELSMINNLFSNVGGTATRAVVIKF